MKDLDEQEVKIVKELIRNPRISDNQISKKTGVPVMSVNRKRKSMEEKGILNYNTIVTRGNTETKVFKPRQLYTVQFKIGVTKDEYIEGMKDDKVFKGPNSRYYVNSYLGEQHGHLSLVIMLEANTHAELLEVFNGKIVPHLKQKFGEDCINAISTVRLYIPIRIHHNYMPLFNMENGVIREDWPDDWIFVQ